MLGAESDTQVHGLPWTRTSSKGPGMEILRRRDLVFYAAAAFASAFLIFLVQPMVGKRILPWYGGVPSVWMVCLAFYQTALFLGYGYAHLLTRFLAPRAQIGVHAAVVAAGFLSLPILPVTPPELASAGDPTMSLVLLLSSSVALPFLVLASTGPLVQAWLARAHPTVSPYPLYAVSNLGSFLALFAYPFGIEPQISLTTAGTVWTGTFVATELLVLACGFPMLRSQKPDQPTEAGEATGPLLPPRMQDSVLWIALAGTAVVVLMGVTNKLCLDVASIPFLWVLPLATYLATFVVAFSSERAYRRAPFVAIAMGSLVITRSFGVDEWVVHQVIAYCALLFSTCFLLHGELYRARPGPRWLTRFYLCVSAGGALGGIFVGLVAPFVWDSYAELDVGLLLAAGLVLMRCARDPRSFLARTAPLWHWCIAAPLLLIFTGWFLWDDLRPDPLQIHAERSFFGVLRIDETRDGVAPQRTLMNGTTVHGVQFTGNQGRRLPTSYYGRATGLGLTLASRPRADHWKIGVVGLGVGTIAAYGRKDDQIRFYEIDPVVARLAGPGGPFTFVESSEAQIEVVLGDARRSIVAEQMRSGSQNFDLLVLDAFTSDSIPIHLMTREAFERYFEAIRPDGLIAVHVTNRHFQLMDLASRMAAELGADSLQIRSEPIPELQSGQADWVILSRETDRLTLLRIRFEKRMSALGSSPHSLLVRRGRDLPLHTVPVWTDDYSDLWSVVLGDEARGATSQIRSRHLWSDPMQDPALASSGSSRSRDESSATPATRAGSSRIAVHVVAIFASAFLIFLVQPMVGKRILPWFGGRPGRLDALSRVLPVDAVPRLCLRPSDDPIREAAAPALDPRGRGRRRARVAARCFRTGPSTSDRGRSDPTLNVLRILLASSVALPFLVLASTGPLGPGLVRPRASDASPYPLYAVSNVGSLLALFVYPFVLEPRLPLDRDRRRSGATDSRRRALVVLACALPVAPAQASGIDPDPFPDRPNRAESPGVVRVAALAAASRGRRDAPDGRHQQALSRCRQHPVPLDPPARDLPASRSSSPSPSERGYRRGRTSSPPRSPPLVTAPVLGPRDDRLSGPRLLRSALQRPA